MDLRDAMAAYSGWAGYGHGDRAGAWVKRLELNAPELEAFRTQPAPPCDAYAATPVALHPADGEPVVLAPLPADAAAALERARSQPQLKAFTWLAETAPPGGKGLLAGVPIVVKDLMRVKGLPLTGGTRALDAAPSSEDAEVVARLRAAGASIIGLTNLHELAAGITSDNVHFGRVVNPAAPDRIPGGSSGGTAAAIAAGIVRLGVGTDTAGSIRIPAACCGIAGFKPSYDAVPRAGVLDLAPSLDHVGPLGARVDDCAILFAAMLGLAAPPPWRRASLARVRVARLGGYFAQPLDAEVRAACDAAVAALARDGASCLEYAIEGMERVPAVQFHTLCPESAAVHAERLRDRGGDIGEEVRVRLELGLFLPGAWYVKAQRMRAQLVQAMDAAFQHADLLLCPTMRTPAPLIGTARVQIDGREYPLHTAVTQLTAPFNLAGLPAATVPWTRSAAGVPISLQVVGPRGADWRVLGAAQRLEALAPLQE
jgi:Asp-tRNA(Asn)/Glu-tRNA(Gln) amidotransferase A subunit family amidase